jgi:hypothetical protein
MTLTSLPTKYALNLKVMASCLAIHWGEFEVHDSVETKNNSGALHHHFIFYVGGILFFYNDGITFYKRLASSQPIMHSKVNAYNYHCHHSHNT